MLYLMLVVVFSRLAKTWWFFLLLGYGKCTVLLEYFAGENLYECAKSAEKLTLCDLTIAFWQGSCVFTSTNFGFAILLSNSRKVCIIMFDTHKTF